jgi:hypothetical protein
MAIEVVPAGPAEEALYPLIPFNPGDPERTEKGEFDTLALAWTQAATVVCNERRVVNFCRSNNYRAIRCISLEAVLRMLWADGIVAQQEVRALIAELDQQGEGVRVSLVFWLRQPRGWRRSPTSQVNPQRPGLVGVTDEDRQRL